MYESIFVPKFMCLFCMSNTVFINVCVDVLMWDYCVSNCVCPNVSVIVSV
jgi:hypothetical protein